MRKDEFIAAANNYTRKTVFCLIPIFLTLIWVIIYSAFKQRFEGYLNARFTHPTSDIVATAPMALPVLLSIVALLPISRGLDRAFGVPCPRCGKPLAQFKAIVIASKSCPHCGAKVLDDEIQTHV
jgi:endogenous inhibitor of DNA gyrase (YacG/DUF329 family)